MSFIGNQALPFNPLATSGKPRDAQRFNGNGSTTIFTLTHPVTNPTDLEVFVENVQQEPLTAFDATGTQLIFTEAPPSGTNNVYVIYRNIEPGIFASIPDGAITFNKLANNIRLFTTDNFTGDNTTVTFGLSSVVPDANTLIVAVDGVFQRAPIHYTASGNTITFASAPPATSNVHVRHLGFRTTQSITALPANTTISQPILQNLVATGASTFPAGSAGAPSITTSGDTNTGIFFPAADTIAFSEGGVESVRIDSSGNLGFGTTSPGFKLDVVTDGGPSIIRNTAYRAAAGQCSYASRFARGSVASPTVVLNGDTIGNLEFYPYNGSNFNLQTASIRAEVNGVVTANNIPTDIIFGIDAAGEAYAVNRERMRITSSGNLLFNSGYGSAAIAYGCRAWVNFNGQGTVAIREDGNVSSITDNGTGDYTVNFTTAMPDANYSAVGMVRQDNSNGNRGAGGVQIKDGADPTASALRILTAYGSTDTSPAAADDVIICCISIFR